MKTSSCKHKPFIHSFAFIDVTLFLTALLCCSSTALADITVEETVIDIPTYRVDPPNPMPRYYEGRTHQGVQRRVYPYPMNDGLTNDKEDRSYPIIYLENEYLKVGIMPGLGGRIFSAVDKTNDYDFFYRQHVIKPSLIGMVGYWISGSNAWGFPHHHGPNTVKAMDYHIQKNPDKSQTVWIANTDQRHRMRILVGYTLFPDSSIIEMTIRPRNRTPIVNSFLFWANPSVHVDENYQVIFPPSVQYVTQHAKREMTTWPIADRRYNNFDYTDVNISWWKNIGVPSSFFSWDPKEDYFGGYDHGKQAGTVWVGNHHTCPGMKFWAWGNNPAGDRANEGLTDEDGHYIELMAGAFTDNQPDYSWLQPYEMKDATMIWFPIRELGGLKYANRNGALNLDVSSDNTTASLGVNTTSVFKQATVILTAAGQTLLKTTIDVGPERPFLTDVKLPEGVSEDDLSVTLLNDRNNVLLSYQPLEHKPADEPIPEPLQAPLPPEEVKTIEQLYLTGLRLDQFYNASVESEPYYREALRRDPGDYRVNTQLGILYLKRSLWKEARKHLQTAVDRITGNYTRPKDGEALYYLGVALRWLGHQDEAYTYFYKAAWSDAWHCPAYYQLAEIDCLRGDYEKAIEHLDRVLTTNVNHLKARNLKAAALRKTGQLKAALKIANNTRKMDVLDHQSANELILLQKAIGSDKESKNALEILDTIMRDDVQSYLELATDYSNFGFYDEAIDALERIEAKNTQYPMVYYYLGYYWEKKGDADKAKHYYTIAGKKPHDYCFPFRAESIDVLQHAGAMVVDDARPPYYLGNLLYELQPENAICEWEKSRELDDTFYIVHRNLALGYEEVQADIPTALSSMEKAVECYRDDPRLLFELDALYEKNKVSPETRYASLKNNHDTAKRRHETLLREATRAVQVADYERAIDILANHSFPQFEGGREKQDTYQSAFVLRGMQKLNKDQATSALEDFKAAMDYPIGRWGRSRTAQFDYLMGKAHQQLGHEQTANKHFEKALEGDIDRSDEYIYYRGMALKELGKTDEAVALFNDLLDAARERTGSDFFRQFEGSRSKDMQKAHHHYLAGLAYDGLEMNAKAKDAFSEVLNFDPGHIWSRVHLDSLEERKPLTHR
jgi:tetratricopeptide (TPR) repeat protein